MVLTSISNTKTYSRQHKNKDVLPGPHQNVLNSSLLSKLKRGFIGLIHVTKDGCQYHRVTGNYNTFIANSTGLCRACYVEKRSLIPVDHSTVQGTEMQTRCNKSFPLQCTNVEIPVTGNASTVQQSRPRCERCQVGGVRQNSR